METRLAQLEEELEKARTRYEVEVRRNESQSARALLLLKSKDMEIRRLTRSMALNGATDASAEASSVATAAAASKASLICEAENIELKATVAAQRARLEEMQTEAGRRGAFGNKVCPNTALGDVTVGNEATHNDVVRDEPVGNELARNVFVRDEAVRDDAARESRELSEELERAALTIQGIPNKSATRSASHKPRHVEKRNAAEIERLRADLCLVKNRAAGAATAAKARVAAARRETTVRQSQLEAARIEAVRFEASAAAIAAAWAAAEATRQAKHAADEKAGAVGNNTVEEVGAALIRVREEAGEAVSKAKDDAEVAVKSAKAEAASVEKRLLQTEAALMEATAEIANLRREPSPKISSREEPRLLADRSLRERELERELAMAQLEVSSLLSEVDELRDAKLSGSSALVVFEAPCAPSSERAEPSLSAHAVESAAAIREREDHLRACRLEHGNEAGLRARLHYEIGARGRLERRAARFQEILAASEARAESAEQWRLALHASLAAHAATEASWRRRRAEADSELVDLRRRLTAAEREIMLRCAAADDARTALAATDAWPSKSKRSPLQSGDDDSRVAAVVARAATASLEQLKRFERCKADARRDTDGLRYALEARCDELEQRNAQLAVVEAKLSEANRVAEAERDRAAAADIAALEARARHEVRSHDWRSEVLEPVLELDEQREVALASALVETKYIVVELETRLEIAEAYADKHLFGLAVASASTDSKLSFRAALDKALRRILALGTTTAKQYGSCRLRHRRDGGRSAEHNDEQTLPSKPTSSCSELCIKSTELRCDGSTQTLPLAVASRVDACTATSADTVDVAADALRKARLAVEADAASVDERLAIEVRALANVIFGDLEQSLEVERQRLEAHAERIASQQCAIESKRSSFIDESRRLQIAVERAIGRLLAKAADYRRRLGVSDVPAKWRVPGAREIAQVEKHNILEERFLTLETALDAVAYAAEATDALSKREITRLREVLAAQTLQIRSLRRRYKQSMEQRQKHDAAAQAQPRNKLLESEDNETRASDCAKLKSLREEAKRHTRALGAAMAALEEQKAKTAAADERARAAEQRLATCRAADEAAGRARILALALEDQRAKTRVEEARATDAEARCARATARSAALTKSLKSLTERKEPPKGVEPPQQAVATVLEDRSRDENDKKERARQRVCIAALRRRVTDAEAKSLAEGAARKEAEARATRAKSATARSESALRVVRDQLSAVRAEAAISKARADANRRDIEARLSRAARDGASQAAQARADADDLVAAFRELATQLGHGLARARQRVAEATCRDFGGFVAASMLDMSRTEINDLLSSLDEHDHHPFVRPPLRKDGGSSPSIEHHRESTSSNSSGLLPVEVSDFLVRVDAALGPPLQRTMLSDTFQSMLEDRLDQERALYRLATPGLSLHRAHSAARGCMPLEPRR